jgi:hypothetical protein
MVVEHVAVREQPLCPAPRDVEVLWLVGVDPVAEDVDELQADGERGNDDDRELPARDRAEGVS